MNPRSHALQNAAKHKQLLITQPKNSSEMFGSDVFNRSVMQKMLSREVYKNVINAMDGKEKIRPEYADAIAAAMKDWALSQGATHYSHWFQPLTGSAAEKHDAFIDWSAPDQVIEKFNGKQLVQGEPDASSFPSGGLRTTFEARGYTGWDPRSPAFLWKGGDEATLCIPTVFFSWTGETLDSKIPLLRSDKRINDAVMRLLKLTGISAHFVNSTLGCEQEYFVIDKVWHTLRPDLLMAGRTVFGAAASKSQELQDHYFASVKDRILCYMRDFEFKALKLGIPLKTRHNEVAPAQHEVAPIFERVSLAVDHNIMLMEIMRQTAVKHDLVCLLHEKPFHGINGSGKHCNWSLATDTGINLLDPSDTPENNLHFLVLLAAILNAVHEHSMLLRASIASASNDFRLGGHEAPPAIMSVYLGVALEELVENITAKGSHTSALKKNEYNFEALVSPEFKRDNTDRNRTSPFAFTGNKFEFRAVGASASPAFPMTVLNAIVAESLDHLVDEIEATLKGKSSSKQAVFEASLEVVRKSFKRSRHVRFGGDNYSEAWTTEAKKRKLANIKKAPEAFASLKHPSTIAAFKGILTKEELHSRYEILLETYIHANKIEANLQLDLFRTHILPVCIAQQKALAKSIAVCADVLGPKQKMNGQKTLLAYLTAQIEKAIHAADALEKTQQHAASLSNVTAKGNAYADKVLPQAEQLREIVDELELRVDDALWPLPKYRELLFIV